MADISRHLGLWGLTSPVCQPFAHTFQGSTSWMVDAREGRFVAKLTYDRRPFVEPGLRVASYLAAAGIPTGAPLPARSGALCAAVGGETPATLAVLEFMDGERLSPEDPGAPRIAGDLLGRVHAILARDSRRDWVPAELLAWAADFAAQNGNRVAVELIAEMTRLAGTGALTVSVIYGDPAPEIIITAAGPALIDWGTPSWGPLLHDVAVWLRWLNPAGDERREGDFLDAYRQPGPLQEAELEHLRLIRQYVDAFFG